MEKEIEIEINEDLIISILAIATLTIIVANEAFVTLHYPIVFGDEGFHSALARWIAKHLEYPIYYEFLGDNVEKAGFYRPPLWNLLGASFFLLYGEEGYRLLLPIVVFTYGLGIFALTSKLWNKKVGFVSMLLATTIPSFVTYSVLFYVDALFTMNMTFFILFYALYEKTKNRKYMVLSGVYGTLAILNKTPGLAVYLFVLFVLLKKLYDYRRLTPTLKELTPLILIIVLSGVFFLRNFMLYHSACIIHTPIDKFFGKNLCTISSYENQLKFAGRTEKVGTEADIYTIGLLNFLGFAYGNLLITVFPLLAGIIYLFETKNSFEKYILLFLTTYVFLWLVSPGIGYRTEDTARYTLGWSGIFMVISSLWLVKLSEYVENVLKKNNIIFAVVVATILSYIFFSSSQYAFFPRLKTLETVKSFSPKFFEACDWVKSHLPKNATLLSLWTYRVAYNCDRRATGGPTDLRLSTDLNTTLKVSKIAGVDYIFLEKFSIDPQNRHYSERYDIDWVKYLENHPEVFKPVYENGINMTQCINYYLSYGYPCDGVKIYKIVKD